MPPFTQKHRKVVGNVRKTLVFIFSGVRQKNKPFLPDFLAGVILIIKMFWVLTGKNLGSSVGGTGLGNISRERSYLALTGRISCMEAQKTSEQVSASPKYHEI